jgi:hypothetical protein
MKMRFTTLGTVLLASALPMVGAVLVIVEHPRRSLDSAPELVQSQHHVDVRTMAGRISHQGGKFIFHEEYRGTTYSIDDQLAAKRYSGKDVLLTGTFDPRVNKVAAHRIEPADLAGGR